MINTDILYLRKFYDKTYIKKIDSIEFVVDEDICELFDNYLLKQLTTLKGRLDAIKKVYHINKNIPVFLDNNLVKEFKRFDLKDYVAIVFQHEYDHLFGTLYVDTIIDEEKAIQSGLVPLWEIE